MNSPRNLSAGARLRAFALLSLAATAACSADYGTGTRSRVTTVNVSLPRLVIEVGEIIQATSVQLDQYGTPVTTGSVTWQSSAPEVAGVGITSGQVLAISAGTARISAKVGGKVGQQVITVTKSPIVINEIKPNGDATTGWVELFNPSAEEVDISGFQITNHDVLHPFVVPELAKIPAGGYRVIDETLIPGGLTGNDAVHLFSKFGVQIDQFAWTVNPAISLGRCPNGTGNFLLNAAVTRGGVNNCG
ncbi:MAG TPA: lamin tail domain-containing protein [Gemmatimonadaceae bacterium]|nr:lamin tail domain-containing protein [Gemmatimonadaceae bacterium]